MFRGLEEEHEAYFVPNGKGLETTPAKGPGGPLNELLGDTRGPHKRIAIRTGTRLADTEADVTDAALDACPVGAFLRKRVGYAVPVGERLYDHSPIGSEIEARAKDE